MTRHAAGHPRPRRPDRPRQRARSALLLRARRGSTSPYLAAALALSLGAPAVPRARAGRTRCAPPTRGDAVSERGVVGAFLVGVGPQRHPSGPRRRRASRSCSPSGASALLLPGDHLVVRRPGARSTPASGSRARSTRSTQGLLPAAPRLPELPAFEISFWAGASELLLLTITVLGIGLVVLVAVLSRGASRASGSTSSRASRSSASRRRYLREVAGVAARRLAAALRFVLALPRRVPHRRLVRQRAAGDERAGDHRRPAVHPGRRRRPAGAARRRPRTARRTRRCSPTRSASSSR